MYKLAIDGGGTKTAACVMDTRGMVVSTAIVSGINPNKITQAELMQRLDQLVTAIEPFSQKIIRIYAGVSGCMLPQPRIVVADALKQLFPHAVITVEHDLRAALFSGTLGGAGTVLIAGTGSVVYGVRPDGTSFRAGGWGPLFSDEGSGTAIGTMAVRAVLKAIDGRAPNTSLTDALCKKLALSSPIQIPIIGAAEPTLLPTFAPLVYEAAENNDPAAIRILTQAATQLASLLEDALQAHMPSESNLPIILTGGILHSIPVIRHQLAVLLPHYSTRFLVPEKPPLYGSAIACLQCAGEEKLPIFD